MNSHHSSSPVQPETLDSQLRRALIELNSEQVSLGRLIEIVGVQGMSLMCILLMLPFLFPISVPGLSTISSVFVLLMGLSTIIGRPPRLPARLADRQIASYRLHSVVERARAFTQRLDSFAKPRFVHLASGRVAMRVNGAALIVAGLLLALPLGLVPLSNTLPAVAIILLCLGMLRSDGAFVIGGYAFIAITVIYMIALALGAGVLLGLGIDALRWGGG